MSAHGMTCTVLATGLAEAVLKDEHGGEGFDLSAGLFGPHVSMWLRDVASQISPNEPKQIRNLDTICEFCQERQFKTPLGVSCPNGHSSED